tara:strand:- start:396 stop:674 length:279 start_codon:yes stop_codon:yes gene_type:complete
LSEEQINKLKKEIERLKKQLSWEHEVLRYIEAEADFSYDYFSYLRTHGGWCPKCEKVDDGEGGEFYGGRLLENPNADGNYECWSCYRNEVET